MKKAITLILLIISSIAQAQDNIAKDILDNLSNTTKSYKNIKFDFISTMQNNTHNINEKEKGVLELEEDKFRLIMKNQIIISDGESQWIYLADMNEVQIIEYDSEDEMMNPNYIFKVYEKGYKYSYIGERKEQGKILQLIELYPKESGPLIKINLEIDSAKNQINKIEMKDKNGGTYTYKITKFEVNTTLEPFTFDTEKFPKIEIIDLR